MDLPRAGRALQARSDGMSERVECRLRALYFCQTRIVAEYHLSNGQVLFCEPLASPVAKWFEDFNTVDALETHSFPYKEMPDLVYEGGKLTAVSGVLKANGPGRVLESNP